MPHTLRFFLFLVVITVPSYSLAQDKAIQFPTDQVQIKTSNGERFFFNVEVAATNETRSQGLMHRKFLAEDSGMLFVFEDIAKRTFWMKDTLIPLDIIFISKDGSIHHIHSNAKPLDESLITSIKPSMAVLEINGGMSDKLGIQAGDKVIHTIFRNTHLQ